VAELILYAIPAFVFWASHVVHHSSEHYNLSTALRQTWTPDGTGGGTRG
jgi:sterol desaturase/sphingolipid hydroxylase (fatty acid hydroxylase superfamily)